METPYTLDYVADAIAEGFERMLAHPDGKTALDVARDAIQAHNKAMAEAVPEAINDGDDRLPPAWSLGFNEARRLFLGEAAQ